jgi:hypothetical protein
VLFRSLGQPFSEWLDGVAGFADVDIPRLKQKLARPA